MDLSLIAAGFWTDPASWWAILQVIFGIGAVIFVHEMGHFLVAKACGVKCEKFYVGFDAFEIKIGDRVLIPRKLVHFQWGETEYGVGILPLGGYVKMLGQDDNPAKMAEERERSVLKGDAENKIDARSYQAKTVPQRMAIISAGVIMNLIFAVIFATFAFRLGVNYEPPEVGSTVNGSPAWINALEGSEVESINEQRTDGRFFSYQYLKEAIILGGYDGPLNMSVRKPGATDPTSLSVQPVKNLIGVKGAENLLAIGISPSVSTKLGSNDPVLDGQAAASAEPAFLGGDEIVEVNGVPVANGYELKRQLAQQLDKTVLLQVKRPAGDTDEAQIQEILVPPNPLRTLGISMRVGPIDAVRHWSPAAAARCLTPGVDPGLRAGDSILTIGGDPIGDPFTLQQRMLQLARQEQTVEIAVSRDGDGNPTQLVFEVSPQLPTNLSATHETRGVAVDSLGINLPLTNVVSAIDGTEAGLSPGDSILSARFKLNDRQKGQTELANAEKKIDLKENPEQWGLVHIFLQRMDPGTKLVVEYTEDGLTKTQELSVANADGYFQETRGIALQLSQRFYQDTTWWGAMQNGFRQTVYDASRVLTFLKKLIRGQLSFRQFGGPGTIAVVATAEATQGTSRLLLFLTLLSANLAIINFLPIPVLDGGHMVFLAYEGVFRRPVGEKLHWALTVAGLIFLIGLMVTVIYLDIWRMT